MEFEDALSAMHITTFMQGISHREKELRLEPLTETLEKTRRSYSLTELLHLDDIALKLKRRKQATSTLDSLDDIRSEYHTPKPLTAYETILQNTPDQYTQRLETLSTFIAENDWGYDDLALCKDYLRTNPYLKRKAKTNEAFAQEKQSMERTIDQALEGYWESLIQETPTKPIHSKKEKILHTAARTVSAALLTAAALPFSLYNYIW